MGRKVGRPPTNGDQSAWARLVVYRLRDYVENNQTGGSPQRVFYLVQKIQRPTDQVRPSRAATSFRVVGPDDGGRLRNSQQRVQQTAAEKDLSDYDRLDLYNS